MSYYIKPPRGEIHLESLIDLSISRMTFLDILHDYNEDYTSNDSVEDKYDKFHENLSERNDNLSSSVMEGTISDRTAHFTLRYAVVASSSSSSSSLHYEFNSYFLERERELFEYRLNTGSSPPSTLLHEFHKHLVQRYKGGGGGGGSNSKLSQIVEMIQEIIDEDLMSSHNFILYVPFYLCSPLVSRRLVELENGYALINKQTINSFLSCLFQIFLEEGLQDLKSIYFCNANHANDQENDDDDDDNPLNVAVNEIHRHFLKNSRVKFEGLRSSNKKLDLNDVDRLSVTSNFPPCFYNLHKKLMEVNRLRHDARIAYTLFLKEIGLSCQQSIQFWSRYYSKNSRNESLCNHTMQKDGKKIIYSIKHLYGLNGSRKNYSAHSCQSIINRGYSSPNEQLICPFSSDKNPTKTCSYSSSPSSSSSNSKILNFQLHSKPSQYFLIRYN